jgi:hypothetical protein
MIEPNQEEIRLPRSYTQTSTDFSVIDVGHAEHADAAALHNTVLRVGNQLAAGTLAPVEVVLRTLGSPYFYRLETYELTSHNCIVYSSDSQGRQVSLTPGSSLVDALIMLPHDAATDSQSGPKSIHFIGKVLDEVNITEPGEEFGPDSERGYVIRFSQIGNEELEMLKRFLAEFRQGEIGARSAQRPTSPNYQGNSVPS